MPASIRATRATGAAIGAVLTVVIVDLALTTAYIHATLGGLLFTLNAAGYAALAALLVLFTVPHPLPRRFAWLPRVALIGYAATTIAAYLVMGPYFSLGWVAKTVETGLVGAVAADLVRLYGSPAGIVDGIVGSVRSAPSRAG